jgi:dihydroflavonol-4-reductase
MIALVTGSTGFIGAHLCRELCEQGIQVRAFHRLGSSTILLDGLPVEDAIGDLRQPESLLPALKNADVLFHAGAMLDGRSGFESLIKVNVDGTRAILDAALQQGVKRVVYTSSVAALGAPEESSRRNKQPVLLTESHTWNLDPEHWRYGYSKYLSEMETQYAVSKGLDVVIVNPAVVFGAGNIHRRQNSPVMLVANRRLPVTVPAGMNVVHIQDVVAGHLAAWQYGKTGGRYILGAHNVNVADLLQKIAGLTGGKAPRVSIPVFLAHRLAGFAKLAQAITRTPLDTSLLHLAGYHFFYDTSKTTRELHLPEPQPLDKCIMDTYEWFKKTA